MRHVSRSHRVALDGLFDRINLDPKIQIKYVDTKNLQENSRGRRKENLRKQNRGQCVWFQQAWTKGNLLLVVRMFPKSQRICSWIQVLFEEPRETAGKRVSKEPRETAGRTLSETESQTQKHILKCGKETTSKDLRETATLFSWSCLRAAQEVVWHHADIDLEPEARDNLLTGWCLLCYITEHLSVERSESTVFSDSVLCLGKMHGHPVKEKWKDPRQ